MSEPVLRPVRRHHRRRHGAAVASPCRCRTPRSPRAPPSSWPTRWAWTRRWSCTPSRWGRTSRSSSSTAGSTTSSTRRKVEVVERDYPLLTPKEVNARDQAGAAPPAGRRRRLHRHRRAHGRHRRDPQHQGLRGGEGPGVLPRAQGGEPRRPGLACPQLVERAREEKADAVLVSQVVTQRDAHLLNTREMSAAFREAYPAGQAPAAGRRRPALRRDDGRRARRRPRLRPGYDARRGRALPRPPARHDRKKARMSAQPTTRSALTVTHRRYVPYSHAHYAGNLVDGAYALGLFGDRARNDYCRMQLPWPRHST